LAVRDAFAPTHRASRGETAEHAAFAEVTRTLTEAREEGRLIQRLPLAEIETGHLVRDRMVFDEAEMAALVASCAPGTAGAHRGRGARRRAAMA
jgi:hypothetical protein